MSATSFSESSYHIRRLSPKPLSRCRFLQTTIFWTSVGSRAGSESSRNNWARIISISSELIVRGSCTRDSSLVVLLREAGTNRQRAWQGFFFPRVLLFSSSLPRCQPSLFLSPPPGGFIIPCHFQRKRIEIIWSRRGMVTYDAPLSVNYLLIILFILAATTPPPSPGQRKWASL